MKNCNIKKLIFNVMMKQIFVVNSSNYGLREIQFLNRVFAR